MKKKTIILILILAALLYILYKRGVFSSKEADGGPGPDPGIPDDTPINPLDDYNTVIERTTMPSDVKIKVKALCRGYWAKAQTKDLGTTNVNGKAVSIYDIEVKSAANLGITLAQQCVRSCINQLTTLVKADGSYWLSRSSANDYMFEVQTLD